MMLSQATILVEGGQRRGYEKTFVKDVGVWSD
jgi:hypothetical protein